MKTFIVAVMLSMSLFLSVGVSASSDLSFTGMQKYKADRISEFLQRMDYSAVHVHKNNNLSTTLQFGNAHMYVVDKHLAELISRHPRELSSTSVTYYLDDTSLADNLQSANLLRKMGVNVNTVRRHLPCEVNNFSGCKVYLIQFYATEKGK